MKDLLSPSDVALALGTSESSVRRWCDNGQLQVARTTGGHRKIDRRAAIRFIRQAQLPVVRPHLLSLSSDLSSENQPLRQQIDQLCMALARGDSESAMALIESVYLNGAGMAEICDGPLRRAMSRIGHNAETKEHAIFLEHRATSICVRILNQLRSLIARPAPGACVALGGGLSNDPFILPSTVAALVFADLGFKDVNLGPDTPWEVVNTSARESNANIVWLSLTAPRPVNLVQNEVNQLAAQLESRGTHLVLGGQSVREYRFASNPMIQLFDSMQELSAFARGVQANAATAPKPRKR